MASDVEALDHRQSQNDELRKESHERIKRKWDVEADNPEGQRVCDKIEKSIQRQ